MTAKAGSTGRTSRSKGTGGTTANGASKGAIVTRKPRKAQMPRTGSGKSAPY